MLRSLAVKIPRFILFILLINFLLRICAMFLLDSYTQPQDWEYGDIAENIVDGYGFSLISEFSHKLETTSSHAPIYPLYLSVFYRAGQDPMIIIIILFIQVILSSLTALIFYRISLIIFNKTAGLLTAIAISFYPPLIYYSVKLTPTVFVIFFIGLTIFLFLKTEKKEYRMAMIAGSIMGISILANPITFTFLPAVLIWYLRKKQINFKTLILVVLSAVIIMGPWTIRNYAVHHRIVPVTTQFGKNFWIGNNVNATGTDYYRVVKNEPDNMVLMTNTLPRNIKDRLAWLSEIERSDYFIKQGKEFIKHNPDKFAILLLKKTYYFWWFTPREINGSSDALKYRSMYIAFYLPLLILGFIGIIIAMKRRYIKHSLLPVVVIIIIASIYIFTHVGLARYRAPVEALLIIFASGSLAVFKEKINRKLLSKKAV
ncbi:MAG: glycosyltransferase family 39 protein [bacterium]